jgi:thymidylate synthase (FAD)
LKPTSRKTIKFLLDAKHHSLFEHIHFQFYIAGMSRALQLQLVRHRNAAYMMSSQHYQDYRDYEMLVHPKYVNDSNVCAALEAANSNYEFLVDQKGIEPYEARQVLPEAKGSHGVVTISARSLINLLNQRLCKRNTPEMLNFAEKLHGSCIVWFPELFDYVHADCRMFGHCTQGFMSCGEPYPKGEWL